jgi:hypothetical protein
MDNKVNELVRRNTIIGSRRLSNYLLTIILLLGGLGFILSGCSSYLKINLLPFADPTQLSFIPQGIIMLFYGVLALCLSLYILLTIIWDIGSGYNEFNKEEEVIRIARNGFPGKNQKILLVYSIKNIKSIKLTIEEGLNPKRIIYLCTKDQRKIPLTQVEQPRSLEELETEASELAKFLDVALEGL